MRAPVSRFVLSLGLSIPLILADRAGAEPGTYSPDVAEPGSVEAILEYTTGPEYLPPSVAYVPDSDTVPSPTDVLGHLVGAPNELTRTAGVHDYFRRLDEASDRVLVRTLGTSEEGREILLAFVSNAENLRDLDRHASVTQRLADPRTTTREEMERLVADGKVFYYLLGGLHSPETGSPEMLMELAYRLAVSERPEIRDIREQAIVLITPVVETDGRDRVVDWYYRHLRGRDLPYEEASKFSSPPYWGHYALHDNNRDGMQLTLALTRAVHSAYYQFRPQVVHDLHESLPLLYISTGHGPYSRAIDPITVNEWTQFAFHEVSELQAQGLPGVWVWGFWDGWWPGYLFSVANNHNSIGRFYETFGNSMAGTFERDLSETKYVGKPVTEVQWYRPWPPGKKVKWSLRNNTNYMQAGVLQALHYAAQHRAELLRNFWVKGERAVQKGRNEAPYAWVLPAAQRDPNRLAYVVNLMQQHRIEVHRLERDFTAGETTHKAGSYVVRMDQPFRETIQNFMEEQKFPADEPNPPYDDVAWTWPLLYGVDASRLDDASILEADLSAVSEPVRPSGEVVGKGEVYLLADRGQNALLAARVLLGRATVEVAEAAFDVTGSSYPAGSWIVRAPEKSVREVAEKLGLDFVAATAPADVPRHVVDLPRLAVLHTWSATQDCGWVRYQLDTEDIPYTLISPDDVKRGRLGDRFDVILFPNTWGELKQIVHGHDTGFGPLAYTKTAEFPSHGIPNESNDITGGMGFAGVRNLDDFVRGGGLLIALANAGTLPVDGGIVRRVDSSRVTGTPGSELRAKFLRPQHPIAYGYDELTSVFRGNSPLFDVRKQDRDLVVLQFGTKKVGDDEEKQGDEAKAGDKDDKAGDKEEAKLVLSGFVKDTATLDGKPAILDVPTGAGRVILFSFNPLHRYLNHSDFRLVYNAVLNWNDLPRPAGSPATVESANRKRANRR
ncbi:MAG TPA: M14 family zinc carboxypeptidase [Candidatus Krumholzibacteria bacterium]|nr:M14 family zinc carboxypeptidase [Candidatus Krumholzibacteria bacterium]